MADTNDDQFLTNNPDDTNPMDDMKRAEELPEDNSPPFSPPSGVQDDFDDTAQAADTNIDPTERYQAGLREAVDVEPPQNVQSAEDDPNAEVV